MKSQAAPLNIWSYSPLRLESKKLAVRGGRAVVGLIFWLPEDRCRIALTPNWSEAAVGSALDNKYQEFMRQRHKLIKAHCSVGTPDSARGLISKLDMFSIGERCPVDVGEFNEHAVLQLARQHFPPTK